VGRSRAENLAQHNRVATSQPPSVSGTYVPAAARARRHARGCARSAHCQCSIRLHCPASPTRRRVPVTVRTSSHRSTGQARTKSTALFSAAASSQTRTRRRCGRSCSCTVIKLRRIAISHQQVASFPVTPQGCAGSCRPASGHVLFIGLAAGAVAAATRVPVTRRPSRHVRFPLSRSG
jgi:hypothetical protein